MDLSSHRLTALHGPSGSGKSLFLDALSFALFGRAFRDINKTDLINTLNGKGLLVEVWFSLAGSEYKITRGLKPNIFQIEINGEAVNQESHAKDQQKYLEDQILKMNWKMFTHVVMLGAANYTPFMRLKPSERKKMVENILGIDVFSTMNAILKSKISDETLRYKSSVEKRDTLDQQIAYLTEQQSVFEAKRKSEILELTSKLKSIADKKKSLDLSILEKKQEIEIEIQSFSPKIEIEPFTETFDSKFTEVFDEAFNEIFTEEFNEVDESIFDTSHLSAQLATKKAELHLLADKIKEQSKQLDFYKKHDSCPTCSQSIDSKFKQKTCAELSDKMIGERQSGISLKKECDALSVEIEKVNEDRVKYNKERVDFQSRRGQFEERKRQYELRRGKFEERRRQFETSLRAFEKRRREHEEKVRNAESLIEIKREEFQKKIDSMRQSLEELKVSHASIVTEAKMIKDAIDDKKSKPLVDNSQEISRITKQVSQYGEEINKSAAQLKLLREVQLIIKDDGIKSEILKRYVPTLNKYINKYLNKMGLFVSFELDQEFNDTIKSRHRDILSYSNYSEGERQRLDLAVLLAWRHLAQAQSAVNTNLLILDEVLDSYLDHTTTENILNLLKGDDFRTFNIIIISHKEGISDNFDVTLQFQKKNNFTSLIS
jgi:DNA repair exonuclease SbcCD ATPase subunit